MLQVENGLPTPLKKKPKTDLYLSGFHTQQKEAFSKIMKNPIPEIPGNYHRLEFQIIIV